ncbi:MAG: methyltransferase domain-containing protein [Armatimonadota bacterium]|nr:methyltransferase domain-containing protein [Armatimonadota bacterium]
MSVKGHANYSEIASSFDIGRRLPDEAIMQWIRLIRRLGRLKRDSLCLDLGCGTGRFAIPLKEITGACVVGADLSAEMLEHAIKKPGASEVLWVRCNAEFLPFRSGIFQCVFMSFLLHHVNDVRRVLSECRRLLKPGGVCLIRTTAHEQMNAMPVYRFFPKAYEIDRRRLPSICAIEEGLRTAGFQKVWHETVVQKLAPSVGAYIEKVRNKNISALTLISEKDFNEGLARMEAHFREIGPKMSLAEVQTEELTLVGAE